MYPHYVNLAFMDWLFLRRGAHLAKPKVGNPGKEVAVNVVQFIRDKQGSQCIIGSIWHCNFGGG